MEHKYLTNAINLIQETPEINHFNDQPEDDDSNEDALSLCDLPLHHSGESDFIDGDHDPDLQHSSSPAVVDANFEFSTAKTLNIDLDTDILLFGKSIFPYKSPKTKSSFRYNKETASHSHISTLATTTPPPLRGRSSSVRLPETGKWPYKSSGVSSFRKQYNVLIGLAAKFDPPRMELSEMRKRQSRKAPAPMFAGFGGEPQVVGSGKRGRKGPWGLFRPLRCGSNLVSA